MSRITHIDGTPTQQRNAIRRTIAEILRRLMDKRNIDDETKDMLAFIVFGLRSMDQSIDQSATAWEKRDYYLKADSSAANGCGCPIPRSVSRRSCAATIGPRPRSSWLASRRASRTSRSPRTPSPLPCGKARIRSCWPRRMANVKGKTSPVLRSTPQ
jgi:hypothetical protein